MKPTMTPIHTALGVGPRPLDVELFESAISAKLVESDRIEWKETLTHDADEFVKDVAALANASGGILVFGMAEVPKLGTARSITPVDLTEKPEQQMHQWVASRVHPIVTALDFARIPISDDERQGILCLLIDPSPDAPHVLGQGEKLGIPYRFGRATSWMRERELALAYRARFDRRDDLHNRIDDLLHRALPSPRNNKGWIVGAATPYSSPALSPARITAERATQIFDRASDLANWILPPDPDRFYPLYDLGTLRRNPRPGLRSQVVEADDARISVHDDGSVQMSAAIDGSEVDTLGPGLHGLPLGLCDSFTADFVALTVAAAELAGTDEFEYSLDLVGNWNPLGYEYDFELLDKERHGSFVLNENVRPGWSRTVTDFQSVGGFLLAQEDQKAMRANADEMARDIADQFGSRHLVPRPALEE